MNEDKFCAEVFRIFDEAKDLTSPQIIAELKILFHKVRLEDQKILAEYFVNKSEESVKKCEAFAEYTKTDQARGSWKNFFKK